MKRSLLCITSITLSLFLQASGPESLDTSFNSTGYLTTVFTPDTITSGNSIVLQKDGKIVVGVTSFSANILTARYNNDGSLDSTFNATGTPGYITTTTMSQMGALIIQPDGKIIITGVPSELQAIMIRYLDNGTIDTSFGTNGYVIPSIIANSYGIALQNDGKIIIAGTNGSTAIIMRYTADGILDTSFGTNGSVTTTIGLNSYATGVQVQADGKIVIAGRTTINSTTNILVARYTSEGVLDTSFGTDGYFTSTLNNNSGAKAYALTIQNDQKIIIVGESSKAFIARLETNGTLDSSFGTNGYTLAKSSLTYTSVALQTNQQTIACGYNNGKQSLIQRYNTNGTADSTLSIITSNTVGIPNLYSIAIALDGKVIVTGTSKLSGVNELLIARILGGITPTTAATSASTYGYNSQWLSEFFYIDAYAQVISDTTARAATIAATNAIISNFASTYANQPSFNFVSYAYLMNEDLAAAEITLASAYPSSSSQITQFFAYILEREEQLL